MTGSNTDGPADGKPQANPQEAAPESPPPAGARPSAVVGPRPTPVFGRRVRPAVAPGTPPGTVPRAPAPPPAKPVEVQPDPARLNDDAYLAAEAVRLGIKVSDDSAAPKLEGDAKVLAEARRLGLRVSNESVADWQEPFDAEMERTAILLGIRSKDALGTPTAAPRKVSKALPWIVLMFVLMGGLTGAIMFMDAIVEYLVTSVRQ